MPSYIQAPEPIRSRKSQTSVIGITARQTDLAAMRVACQQQVEPGMRGLVIDSGVCESRIEKASAGTSSAAFSMLSTLKKCASSIPAI